MASCVSLCSITNQFKLSSPRQHHFIVYNSVIWECGLRVQSTLTEMLETQLKDVDLASPRSVDPRWPHSHARALVLAVNWVSRFPPHGHSPSNRIVWVPEGHKQKLSGFFRFRLGTRCFPVLLVSEARRKEAGSNASSMAPSIYCLVCAVAEQALACPFQVPWWD